MALPVKKKVVHKKLSVKQNPKFKQLVYKVILISGVWSFGDSGVYYPTD
ncbi:MAG: hypothetical protein ACTS73_08455 [Arsenophonus sp. NEOnobi-MAG3]